MYVHSSGVNLLCRALNRLWEPGAVGLINPLCLRFAPHPDALEVLSVIHSSRSSSFLAPWVMLRDLY
jgi:hypothetical protein